MKLSKLYKKECRIGKKSKRARKKLKQQLIYKRRVIHLDQLYEEVKLHKNLEEVLSTNFGMLNKPPSPVHNYRTTT